MSDYLKFCNISMVFPGVKALDDISFRINRGEVVAFLGENGAGKSTLLKILNGDYHQTGGQIQIDGKTVSFQTPNDAIKAGISVIYQERQLAPYLSVAENIFLGNLPTKKGLIDYRALNERAQEVIEKFGVSIKPTDQVRNISVAYQQMVEIMKAYVRNAEIVCFDEPTAPLTDKETEKLFQIIQQLREQGKVIIYVSHRLNEIFRIADRVVVFKDGTLIDVLPVAETDERDLIRLMVGRPLGDIFKSLKRNQIFGDVVLSLRNVCTKKVHNISLDVRAGEIVGLAGLVGAGRTELAEAVFGVDQIIDGEMLLNHKPFLPQSTKEAMAAGIALCPEDRKNQGLTLIRSVKENLSLATLNQLSSNLGFINQKKEHAFVATAIDMFDIKTPSAEQKVINLSGGNQQKIILARWMATNPKLIIYDEPTKGIDVGAKAEIYAQICEAARKGVAVILISSELTEILGLADRIAVLKDGRITRILDRREATEEVVLSFAMLDNEENGGILNGKK